MTAAHPELGDYPELDALMNAGFHQDVWEDHDTWQEVVADFTGSQVFDVRIRLEIEELLSLGPAECAAALGDPVAAFIEGSFGVPVQEWLRQVSEQVVRETPEPDGRYVDLVGRSVEQVDVDPGSGALRVSLGGGVAVDFCSGVGVKAPGGAVLAPGLVVPRSTRSGRAPFDPVQLAREAVGEQVLVASEKEDQLSLATRTVRLYAAPHGDQPWFVVHRALPS